MLASSVLALGLTLPLSGCLDNPACIFGGNCSSTTTPGIGANPATFPVTGQWIDSENPSVDQAFPAGNQVHPSSPVVIVFSESMNSASTTGAFVLQDTATGFSLPTSGSLVGDGRVLVLIPGAGGFSGGMGPGGMDGPLTGGTTYEIRIADGEQPFDLTGQEFNDGDGVIGSFTVATSPSDVPSVVMTWPADGATDASSLTEFVVVFDQAVDPTSVTATSMFVTVDGAPPQVPPAEFQQLMISVPLSPTTPEPRVWTYRNEDTDGNPLPLLTQADVDMGALGAVDLRISPASSPIQSLDMMQEVAETPIAMTIQTLFPPVQASIMSTPNDAIGIRNLVDPMGGDGDLAVDLILEEGLLGDVVEIWLFGVVTGADDLPVNAAFLREFTLDADMDTVTLTEMELDLATSTMPLTTIVNDGDLGIAYRVRRGLLSTQVFVMDVDPMTAGVQDAILDITPPELVGLGSENLPPTEFRSNLRNMTLFGTASEELRECDVTVTIGPSMFTNGTDTPVLTSRSDGTFLAAPVMLPASGTVDPTGSPASFSAILRDRAFNTTATPIVGNFIQVGSTAPGTALMPSDPITVEVLDARTLLPIQDAMVFSHQEDMGVVTSISVVFTDANGIAVVGSATMGETIVSIDAFNIDTGGTATIDYDLFTFHGVTTNRLSVPLTRAEETILTQSTVAVLSPPGDFSALDGLASDSRIDPLLDQTATMDLCFDGGLGLESCSGSPFIRPGRVGSVSALGLVFPTGLGTFNPLSFLRAFEFEVGRPSVNTFGGDGVNFDIDAFLDDPGVPDEELAIEWMPQPVVETAATTGINLGNLDGTPSVLIQANVPGLPGSLSVGAGVTFDDMTGGFDLRAAYPGVVDTVQDGPMDMLGDLVQRELIESELRLRVELKELPLGGSFFSNRAGARPTLSSAPTQIFPLGVATIQAPMPLTPTGPDGYDVVFDGVIFDQIVMLGKRGLYEVRITGTDDREWVLYRPDQNNTLGQFVSVHVPDLTGLGGMGLPDADLVTTVSAYAWTGFDLTDFFWSDIEREYDLFSHTLPTTYNNIP